MLHRPWQRRRVFKQTAATRERKREREQLGTRPDYAHHNYFQVFDREGDDGKFVSVTVKATDQGEPSLEGVCSFTVEITDVNDNPPLFDRQVRRRDKKDYYNYNYRFRSKYL